MIVLPRDRLVRFILSPLARVPMTFVALCVALVITACVPLMVCAKWWRLGFCRAAREGGFVIAGMWFDFADVALGGRLSTREAERIRRQSEAITAQRAGAHVRLR